MTIPNPLDVDRISGAGEFESQCILGNGLIKMLSDGYSADQAVDYIVGELEKLL